LKFLKEEKMKALRWYAKEDMRYEDVPEPSPGPGQVKIKVHFAGICGSDLHEYLDGPVLITEEAHPVTGQKAPITLGHEFSGTVVGVGDGVSSVKVGERVTADCPISCGKCFYCMRDLPTHCLEVFYAGFHADGAMAEYMLAPESEVYKLPDSISDEIGALLEPLAVGIHGVRRSRLQEGDTVSILGTGPIGLSTLLAARAAGASKIFALEISEQRRKMALAMGATTVINPKEVDAVKQICELTDGLGVDVSFDCIGHPISGPLAVELARTVGTVVIVGVSPGVSPDFNFLSIMLPEKTVLGSNGYTREIGMAIELVADGRIDPARLITGKVPLKDSGEKGFKELINNPEKNLKILLQP
jgi:(R,R)-butanediol dehydrogenase/meso-butanediol dehydrogenase/diacetyl reductase